MSQEHDIEKIEEGREAILARAAVRQLIDDQMRVAITLMIAEYRGGDIRHDFVIGKVAELAALEGLLAEFDAREQRGIVAANREFNRGQKT